MAKQTVLKSSKYLRAIRASIERLREDAIEKAELIAELAEPPMKEFQSAKALADMLAEASFRVTWPWANIPTAFKATFGKGRPKIALLAEYDALPDCGRRSGQWGHGCGHNLLGVASVVAGIVSAKVLDRVGMEGQIVVFGTPAEESLSGKVLMAEQGAFKGLDAVLAWHPGGSTSVMLAGGLAMDSVSFVFKGRTAHAAGAPHKGRSALDGAMLTDIAVNYMREHIESNARIHSVIPQGGVAPNVVPDRAEIWYYVRGRDRNQVDELTAWVTRCAKAGAMATQTTCRRVFHDSVAERIPNRVLAEAMEAICRRCGHPRFTQQEQRAVAKIVPEGKYATGIEGIKTEQGSGSSDEDNVSWFAPLARLTVACVPSGTVGHHRQYAEAVRTPGAHRGMCKAAEYLAAGAVELAINKRLLNKAKAEYKKNRRPKQYKLPKRSSGPHH